MSTPRPVGVPVALTTFVGRAREVATIRQLLGAARLLTLTGAGGSGKTRLAAEIAAQTAGEYRDGVAWVELAPLSDAAFLSAHVAGALGIREEATRATSDVLAETLRDRALLLVLDNCEHVVDACAALTEAILRECPHVRVLATSREALGVAGERAWLVPPLPTPTESMALQPETLAQVEAVQLFVERAQSALASFELTDRNAAALARICRRLDGLPLAIELAAARVRVLTPEQIAQRLDDSFEVLSTRVRGVPTRHQTLHAAVHWSYRLLAQQEQLLLARLSVFTGGFTLVAMEAVCAGDGIAPPETLDLLAGLVDKSLVVMHEQDGAARYTLLEIVRQFARGRLEEAATAAGCVRRRHAEFFVALAETALPELRRSSSQTWLSRLATEQDNFRVALGWSLATPGATEIALRLTGALWWFWGQRGQYAEGLKWLETALSHPDGRGASAARAHALAGAGAIAVFYGDLPRARALLEESVAVWEQVASDPPERAHSLSTFAFLLADLGEYDTALRYGREAVQRARDIGTPWLVSISLLNGVTHAYAKRGDLDLADQACAEARAAAERDGFTWGVVESALRRALIAMRRGEVEPAASQARAAAQACLDSGDTFTAFRVRAVLVAAAVAVRQGDADRAARLFGASATMRESLGALMLPYGQSEYEQWLAETRHALGEAAFASRWTQGRTMALRQSLELAAAGQGVEQDATPADLPTAPYVVRPETTVGAAPPTVSAAPDPLVLPALRTSEPQTVQSQAPGPKAHRPETSGTETPELQVLALGPLRILRRGEPLPGDAWPYARPRELLLYLLCHPDGRTREQIGLVFWPDATAAQLRNNFHVTLHHVRKALGRADWITFEGDHYTINWSLGLEFDARVFQTTIGAALRGARAEDGVGRLQAALALYRGDFLEEASAGDWHLEHRDHLRRRYVEGMLALGERLSARGDDAGAADAYRHVVLREPLHEEAYRRLMTCLARSGERTQALRHFERLATLLRTDLEAEPELETRALYDRLRRAEPV